MNVVQNLISPLLSTRPKFRYFASNIITIKKFDLDIEFEYDFLLYGIVSQEKAHRLAWFINRTNLFNFVRVQDYELNLGGKDCGFTQFQFHEEENHLYYTLLANRDEQSLLLPDVKNFDYLMIIKGALDFFEEDVFKASLKQISVVQLIYPIETEKLKSKQHLIYV